MCESHRFKINAIVISVYPILFYSLLSTLGGYWRGKPRRNKIRDAVVFPISSVELLSGATDVPWKEYDRSTDNCWLDLFDEDASCKICLELDIWNRTSLKGFKKFNFDGLCTSTAGHTNMLNKDLKILVEWKPYVWNSHHHSAIIKTKRNKGVHSL